VMVRGLVQGRLGSMTAWPQCVLAAVIFGGQHFANVLFGREIFDTAAQVVNATCFGFAYAAARSALVTVWPLALLHGLGDFTYANSDVPFPVAPHVAFGAIYLSYGAALLVWLRHKSVPQAAGGNAGSRP
jgi:hypothetical protein